MEEVGEVFSLLIEIIVFIIIIFTSDSMDVFKQWEERTEI